MTKFIAAQGDVLLVQADAIPASATPVPADGGRVILAHGEATGHHHSFPHRSGAVLFRDDGGGSYVSLPSAAPLEHQEHSTIEVPGGTYRVVRQRVAHSGLVRRVVD